MTGDETEYDTIDVARSGRTATVTVDRPESMNSLNVDVLEELAAAIEAAMADDAIKVVVLTGRGDEAFVSGADIGDFVANDGLWWKINFRRSFEEVERATEGGKKPVVAAVDGVALGGGSELVLLCDFVIATESARFGFPEISLGGMPGVGGAQRLARHVGVLAAKDLVMTGRRVGAEEASDMGLVTRVVDDDAFDEDDADLAADLAAGPPVAMWFAKEVLNRSRGDLETGLALEEALGTMLFETDDFDEGTSAFVEQRATEFADWKDLD